MTAEIKTPERPEKSPESPQDTQVVTKHSAIVAGKEISYTVTTGRMVLKEEITKADGDTKDQYEGEKARAEIFYIAYTLDDGAGQPNAKRPLTFAFNGGPGSASLWVHLGLLGPKRVKLLEDGSPLPPPAELIDNESSILDLTDLVFIDPVGTGYSRAAVGDKPNEFWGWKKDVESISEFIRSYVSRNQRWSSPKFIAGESYGSTRTAGIADFLSEKHGLYLNGIILISTALDFSTLDFNPGNDLPYALILPSYAATAWYHKQLDPKLQKKPLPELLAEVRKFAGGTYMTALFEGARLSESEQNAVARKIAAYCGLSLDFVLQSNLRIPLPRFTKELLRTQRRTVGRLDSRFIGMDRDAAGEAPEDDPSSYELSGAFAGAMNDYLGRDLAYQTDLEYTFSADLWKIWSYKEHENQYVQLEEVLRRTMVRNKFMKVWVLNGYYDLATPFYASEYVFNHLQLEPSLMENLWMTYYEAGHMMYVHQPSLEAFRKHAEEFYIKAIQ